MIFDAASPARPARPAIQPAAVRNPYAPATSPGGDTFEATSPPPMAAPLSTDAAAGGSTLTRVLFTGLFVGLSALSALPSPVHAAVPGVVSPIVDKAPAAQAHHVFEDVFTGAYPTPADWHEQTLTFGNVQYHTVVPPGWSVSPSGTGFVIRKDADPRVFLEVRDAAVTSDLRQVIETQKHELARQGISLRERETIKQDPLLVSVNDVKGSNGSRKAEIIAIVDVESESGPVSASVTSIVYKEGEDQAVFPTVLQHTSKSIVMDTPLPIPR